MYHSVCGFCCPYLFLFGSLTIVGGLFGSFTPSVKAKVRVVAASYSGTGTGGTTH